jgi:hypothetical protein
VTIAIRPLVQGHETAGFMDLIWVKREGKYFCANDWTQPQIMASAVARMSKSDIRDSRIRVLCACASLRPSLPRSRCSRGERTSSLPGLTRQSIHLHQKAFSEGRWMRGSSPRMMRGGRSPDERKRYSGFPHPGSLCRGPCIDDRSRTSLRSPLAPFPPPAKQSIGAD